MASSNHTVVVSVLGLSRLDGENFSSHQGIGKSCLCYRFMYPGYDDYQQDHRSHSSLLALHEFESDVIHKDHFLYWGSTTRTYDAKGSSEKVQFEVLEYPVFYEDITDQPFHSKKSIGSLDGYMRMVLARTLDSPGKHRRGYVVVIDVSDNGPTFESRLRLTEKMVAHLASRKQKFICAATKTDESLATSLEKLSELARRNKFTLIEVSAKTNVNVTEMFEIVAAKVLGKTVQGLQTHVPPYSDAAQKTLSIRNSARQAFRTYLQKRVTVASELLTAIERTEEYKACAHLHGKFETDKMFAQHVLTLRNDEVSTSANVMDKVNIRQQFLEAYVAERTDLSPYTKYLKEGLAQRPPIQKAFSAKMDDFQFNQLFNSSSLADRARLLSISSPHALSWLSVVPSKGLGLHLNPDQFQVAIKWWLGLNASGGSLCSLCPNTVLDPLGHHASTCKHGGDAVFRHNRLRDVVAESCRLAHLSVKVEARNNLTPDHSHTRPADVLVQNWSRGRPAAFDMCDLKA
ncbi:hypothetical protein EMCRGX_G002286 [Ephydatia muelleri]